MMYLKASLFAMMLAAAGLPLYIHLPRFAATDLGLPLSTVGAMLIALRFVDFAQDPFLGRWVDRFPQWRAGFAGLAAAGMAIGFIMLFTLPSKAFPLAWVVVALLILFTAYSLGSILFYSQSAALAPTPGALVRLAGFREAGGLAGVVLAALAPAALGWALGAERAFAGFGLVLAALCGVTAFATRGLWRCAADTPPVPEARLRLSDLRGGESGRLLLVALVNSLPVAMTSTLFVFFVEDRLMLSGMAGPFLIAFFLSAGVSVPLWTRASHRFGARVVLAPAMGLAVAAFVWAAFLGPGDMTEFALICVGSGMALGADMVLLPVLFSASLQRAGLGAGQAFGLWFLVGKLSLALAAVGLLPALEWGGFRPGGDNSPQVLALLGISYAVVPCLIKLCALTLVLRLPKEGSKP